MRITTITTLGAAAFFAAACGDATGPSSTESVSSLMSAVESAHTMGASGSAFGGGFVPNVSHRADGCAFNATTQRFDCPTTTTNTATIERWFQLLDASGNPQSAYDRATTAALRNVVDIEGSNTISRGDHSGTISFSHEGDHTLSGLLDGVHTLNGSSSTTGTVTTATGSWTMTTNQTITGLVLPRAGDNRYPKAGTIVTEVIAPGFLGVGTYTTRVTMTFDGTSVAKLNIVSGGASRDCTVDLSKRNSWPVCAA